MPTASSADELAYGKSLLIAKLEVAKPEIVLFTFKKTATVLFGRFAGYGFIDKKLADGDVFVMPGPYERANRAHDAVAKLAWRMRN